MTRSESIANLAAALAAAQSKIAPAIKSSVNPHFRSHYADLTAVWEAIRGPLADNGLSVAQFPCDGPNNRVGLTTILLHESGEWLSETVSAQPAKDDPQGIGSCLTYLRRYSLAAAVGCTATEDDDANAASLPPQATARPTGLATVFPPKAKPPAPPVTEQRTVASPSPNAGVEVYEVVGVESKEGVAKATGKPYTKHTLHLMSSLGNPLKATTFKDNLVDTAMDCKDRRESVVLELRTSQFGVELVSVVGSGNYLAATGAAAEADKRDEIPF